MNVSGVSPLTTAANNLSVSNAATIKVMDMTEDVTEDVMGTLLGSMDAMISGVGANVNQMA